MYRQEGEEGREINSAVIIRQSLHRFLFSRLEREEHFKALWKTVSQFLDFSYS